MKWAGNRNKSKRNGRESTSGTRSSASSCLMTQGRDVMLIPCASLCSFQYHSSILPIPLLLRTRAGIDGAHVRVGIQIPHVYDVVERARKGNCCRHQRCRQSTPIRKKKKRTGSVAAGGHRDDAELMPREALGGLVVGAVPARHRHEHSAIKANKRSGAPDLDRLVDRSRHDLVRLGRPGDAPDAIGMRCKRGRETEGERVR